MIFWETRISYKDKKTDTPGVNNLSVSGEFSIPKQEWTNCMNSLNTVMGCQCDPDGKISVYFVKGSPGSLMAVMAHPIKNASLKYCLDYIKETLENEFAVCDVSFSEEKEITCKSFKGLLDKADNAGYVDSWFCDSNTLHLDYECSRFGITEYIEEKVLDTLTDAKNATAEIMADRTLVEELDRIYSDENEKEYYGNPVHYHISASTFTAALDIVNTIVPSLVANKRLCSRRVLKISDISERCFDEERLKYAFESAQGNAVVIEMSGTDEDHGNFASAYHRVVDFINKMISLYHLNTLCFFVEIKDRSGFTNALLAKAAENIHVIRIKEGFGDRAQAENYLKNLAKKDEFAIPDKNLQEALSDKKLFTVADVYEIYDKLFKNGLSSNVYKAYKNCEFSSIVLKAENNEPYEDLQKMVGLTEIKKLVDQIIAAGKIRKMRDGFGLKAKKPSLHMVFTGNPGSAKTTVARLLAQILRKEDILDGGNLVECGRSDLIGKYVGWTAKEVCAKFREAKGGILFIDEAYSLVDDSHSFADEAINTIVQEMENNREDVIVIFAGYPDKMKDFLNKNEGLRSRIAFHLDFPDYNPSEMMEILKLMADEQGYKIDDTACDKCMGIFEEACCTPDFGNGRFVRNLLEQAEMAQSHRIAVSSHSGKITKTLLCTLKAEDFDVNVSRQTGTTKQPMGFAV